jgi:integrase/recombinase XerD
MSPLREGVEQYLSLRRHLGFELRRAGRLLATFVDFLEAEGATHITTEDAVRWAVMPAQAQQATWSTRLGVVRRFATWMSARDTRTEVPPHGLLCGRYRRQHPYIYSDDEIRIIVSDARALACSRDLRGPTYSTLFGLLAVSGLRIGEAVALDRHDVDLEQGILSIRRAKFGKSRFVPVHPSTLSALRAYADIRDRVVPRCATLAFFVSARGERITQGAAQGNFAIVSRRIGLRPATGTRRGRGPRLHDMRHRFAARTLIDWYRAGLDVEREMPKLSTYLGHVHVNDTYWYIEAVPELLQLATERLMRTRTQGES